MKTFSRRQFLKKTAKFAALGAVVGYPVFGERHVVLVNNYRIRVPNLPPAFTGFRIVHLTDLHYGLLMPRSLVRSVVRRANRIGRDLTVCTGDYVQKRMASAQIDRVWPILSELHAPFGVLSVLGNHDHWADTVRSRHWLEASGQDMRHRVRLVEKDGARLWFAGAGDLWEDHKDVDELLGEIPEPDCRIVLAHNPDTADTDFTTRVDFMICGHTHGGQVNLPFIGTPVLPVQNKAYTSGLLAARAGFPLFISRGIGWAVLPVRFRCFPEIAVLELMPE